MNSIKYKQTVLTFVVIVLSICINSRSQNMAVTSDGEIIAGGPSAIAAQKALQSRIELQAAGRIKLLNFKPTTIKLVEKEGKAHCDFGFESQILFNQPCQWAIRFGGEPLSFKTFKLNESAGSNTVITVSRNGESYTIFGSMGFLRGTNNWVDSGVASMDAPKLTSEVFRNRCIYNLRRISAAFAGYEIEHDGRNPFNISTNSGGTLELCGRNNDGFDTNSALHYRLMADGLGSANLLICPEDSSNQIAKDFQSLMETNVTYQIDSSFNGDNGTHPSKVLTICPMHGFKLYFDGSIEGEGNK